MSGVSKYPPGKPVVNRGEMDISKIVVPQNGWFIMENPIKLDDLGIPLFLETPKWGLFPLLAGPAPMSNFQTHRVKWGPVFKGAKKEIGI